VAQATEIFTTPASEQTLLAVVAALKARNIEAVIADSAAEARRLVLEKVPRGAEVHSGKSKTLQDAGIMDMIMDPSLFDALRPRYTKTDRQRWPPRPPPANSAPTRTRPAR
jgi:hypothetical protein